MIARAAEGSVRDALSLLDQAIAHASGTVSADEVRTMLGLVDRARVIDLFGCSRARWLVLVSKEAGEKPIAATARERRESLFREARDHPDVRAVLERFPGAEIVDVRDDAAPDAPPDEPSPRRTTKPTDAHSTKLRGMTR
jgi:hypothetical protein